MKIYYYMIISVGIMLTLALAGIDGVGTNVRTLFIDNDTIIQPITQYNGSISEDPSGVVDDISDTGTNFWNKILIGLLAMAILGGITGVQILGSGISFDVRRVVMSIVSYILFGLLVVDMWSIVTLVFSYGVDWVSWFLAVLVSVYVVGFAIALLEFTGGTD